MPPRYPVRGPGSLDAPIHPTVLTALPLAEAGNPRQNLPGKTCGEGVRPLPFGPVWGGVPWDIKGSPPPTRSALIDRTIIYLSADL